MSKSTISGWGKYLPLESEIHYPVNPTSEIPEGRIHPRGMGRSYGDASLPARGHIAWDTRYLNHLIHFDPNSGLLTCEPGVSFQQILEIFIPKGFFLPVTPGTMFVSVGGAVASNIHGKNHHRDGSLENFIEELEVATPIGPYRCSRVENPELFYATVGGYGLTGLIREIKIKLIPIQSSYILQQSYRARDLEHLFRLFEEKEKKSSYSVAWLDSTGKGKVGRGVLILGRHAHREELPTSEIDNPLLYSTKKKINLPFDLPTWMSHSFILRLLNALYYHHYKDYAEIMTPYESFFYPLDRILNWNRFYGKSGFFQYQFCISDPQAEQGILECLKFLVAHKMGSFVTVLKRCDNDNVALPFCRKGYTLALDLPFRSAETLSNLDKLDNLVIQRGGRVYLTKDARLSPEAFRAMYPEFPNWINTVRQYNPNRMHFSKMAERLQFWEQ